MMYYFVCLNNLNLYIYIEWVMYLFKLMRNIKIGSYIVFFIGIVEVIDI